MYAKKIDKGCLIAEGESFAGDEIFAESGAETTEVNFYEYDLES